MAIFKASVELHVKITRDGSGQPNQEASAALVLYTTLFDVRAPSCAPREAFPSDVRAPATALTTQSGFRIVVAALSR